MRIATLQFAARLGEVERNIERANELLKSGRVIEGWSDDGESANVRTGVEGLGVEVLVLPEMALTGYNFPSLEAIRPYLEPAGEGVSAKWARETAQRLKCKVCVGYPEIEKTQSEKGEEEEKCYNSLLMVDEQGEVIVNYRKSFLYYTDETWAAEGNVERGYHELSMKDDKKVATSFGICMDINPYKFEAPFTAWEFANRILDSKSQLVIVSMAWLTTMDREELDDLAGKPDMDTFNYWIQRLVPLIRQRMKHGGDGDGPGSEKKIVIVFANRSGEEEGADGKPPVRYAGTSTIIAVTQRPLGSVNKDVVDEDEDVPFDVKILCWDLKGATEEGICFADTTADPEMVFRLAKASG